MHLMLVSKRHQCSGSTVSPLQHASVPKTIVPQLTTEDSVPHPVINQFSWRSVTSWRHGFVQSLSVEHHAVVEPSSDDVHLNTTNHNLTSILKVVM